MNQTYKIDFIEKEEMEIIIPLLQLLDAKLDEAVLKLRIAEMIKNGYQCIGVRDEERLIGISGIWILEKYYTGKHVEPDNFVIHPDYRGKKIGEALSQWIDDYAKSIGGVASNLNCYVTNQSALKFWINQGYKIISFHLQKKY